MQDRILVVDDDPMNIRVFVELLQADYTLSIARSGEEALDQLGKGVSPDLILLDIMMPGLDGFAVCARLKADEALKSIPVIFITAMNQSFDETRGFEAGAVDYITKPIVPPVLLARVQTQIKLRRSQRALETQNDRLEELVQIRTHELGLTQDVMIRALANLSELSEGRSELLRRVQHGVVTLARSLQNHPSIGNTISKNYLDRLFRSSALQNIGMVGLPNEVVNQRHPLTPEALAVFKTHPSVGREALLNSLAAEATESIEFLQEAVDIVGSHHENWDGTGYPDGLRGEEIPLSARIVHLVNAYNEAMVNDPVGGHEDAILAVRNAAGQALDPRLVSAFLSVTEEFRLISAHYPDR